VNTTYLANIVICFHCVETSTKSNHSLIMFSFFETSTFETRSSLNHSHVPHLVGSLFYFWPVLLKREASFNHCYIYNLKVNQMIHKIIITVALNCSHNNSCIIILYIANNQGQCNWCSLDRSHAAIATTSKTMITWPWLPLQTLLKVLITTMVKIQNEVP
jgi:hypothetical protein